MMQVFTFAFALLLSTQAFADSATYQCELIEGNGYKSEPNLATYLEVELNEDGWISFSGESARNGPIACEGQLHLDRTYPFHQYYFGKVEGDDCGFLRQGKVRTSDLGLDGTLVLEDLFELELLFGFVKNRFRCEQTSKNTSWF